MIYTNPFIELSDAKWDYLNNRTLEELHKLKRLKKTYLAVMAIIQQRENYSSQNLMFLPKTGRDND